LTQDLVMPQHLDAERRNGKRIVRIAAVAAKLLVTGACFWYLARRIDIAEIDRTARSIDMRWAGLAVLALMLQIPLVGWRWSKIVDALERGRKPIRRGPVIAIMAISNFFGQIMPNVAADTVRVWMLTRIGQGWQRALASVLIDRAVGIAVLAAISLTILLFPSALGNLGGHRGVAIEVFGAIFAGAVVGLALARPLAHVLEGWPYTRWAGKLAASAHVVLLGSGAGAAIACIALAVHGLSILAIWILGWAAGLSLSASGAAVLFTVMLGVALIPVSISGWGVRELAVTALLAEQGIPLEQALFFSLSFGFAILIAALPGAVVWAAYSPGRVAGAASSIT
jgi:uncharacterized membrane protein YbhN (UPF0104 family)